MDLRMSQWRYEMNEATKHVQNYHEIRQVEQTTCCIVGGGPGGALLALLLARAGVPVTLLEAHMDFEREFRGDTLHPAGMEVLDQLGLADRLLQLRHTRMQRFAIQSSRGRISIDLSSLKTKFPYITVIAQARFLDFLMEEARRYPNFRLVMGAQVDEVIEKDGVIQGVRYRGQDGWYEMRAALTVAADGRFSRLRRLAGFEPIKTSPPIDILWFRLSRREDDPIEGLGGRFQSGIIVAIINRFDYWQVGYVIPKGEYQKIRDAGLEYFQQQLAKAVPEFTDRVAELQNWQQISILSVESSRLARWHRPGLLLIGDAAHVMSPVGGVGINYAIQDAVATANVLTKKLLHGTVTEQDLAEIQRQRELPTKVIQRFQTVIQKQVLSKALHSSPDQPFQIPPFFQMIMGSPLRHLIARLIGFGLWPARIKQELLSQEIHSA
jgi:2-polyprenyl-6-methoxyphenol hydroxylase-like FAD-dependent oxidoreductase